MPNPSSTAFEPVSVNDQPLAMGQAVFAGQLTIVTTGTAVQFPSFQGVNGVVILNSGTSTLYVGPAGVNNTGGGTGNGFILTQGAAVSVGAEDANEIWINGQSGGFCSYIGS